jgi:glycosyltransferase involved in cell wall biosynthesis
MIEALEQIKQHDWHLVIVGDGNLKETYRANAEANGLADRITFAGSVSNEDLPRYYRMADMHLFPSTKRAEAFGLVAMEAAASGVPSIASDLPGVRTVVLDGDTGLLVPPANVEELKKAILLLLEQVDLRERLGLSARKQAEQRYAWEPLIDRLEETYASVLNQQSERNYDV